MLVLDLLTYLKEYTHHHLTYPDCISSRFLCCSRNTLVAFPVRLNTKNRGPDLRTTAKLLSVYVVGPMLQDRFCGSSCKAWQNTGSCLLVLVLDLLTYLKVYAYHHLTYPNCMWSRFLCCSRNTLVAFPVRLNT